MSTKASTYQRAPQQTDADGLFAGRPERSGERAGKRTDQFLAEGATVGDRAPRPTSTSMLEVVVAP